jgi:cobalt-zinc-cadmium efflux system outer membrane protein
VWSVVVTLAAWVVPSAGQPLRLTLEEAVQRALKENAELLAGARDVDVAAAALRRSSSRFPSNPYVSFGASRRAEIGGRPNVFAFLSQEVEIAGQRAPRMRAAQHNLQQENSNVRQKQVTLAADVKAAFTRVLARSARVSKLQEQVNLARQLVALLPAKQITLSERIERNNAAIHEARFRRELWAAEQERDAELDGLRRLLNLDLQQELELMGTLDPVVRLLPPVSSLIEQAKRQRADILAFQHALAAADAQIEVHRRERIPNLTLSGSYSRFDNSDFGGGDLGVTVPLFQTKEADIQEATAQRQRIAFQLQDLERGVEREVRSAYREYQQAARELRLFNDELLPLAEENAQLQRRLVERDEASRSELLTAQLDMLETKKDFLETLERLSLAWIELERAVGGQVPDASTASPPPPR